MSRDEEIVKMLDFLGVDKFYVGDPICTYWFSRSTMSVQGLSPSSLYSTEQMEATAYEEMVEACRKKALKKWVDIELANNNLFWCCHEQ